MQNETDEIPWATRVGYRATDLVARALIRTALALPYLWRVRFMGFLMARLIGPLAGFRKRARRHVAFALPHLPHAEHARIAQACLNNAGRTLIENYSTATLLRRQADAEITGPGLAALATAAAEGRAVILVTGHFGNYEAVRAALTGRGYAIGGLYRDMSNPYFNAHYAQTMQAFGGPVFPRTRRGTAGFVRHLKAGGQLVMLFDQHVLNGEVLDFLGHPARTTTSPADLALRYDALLIPFYGIRRPDGIGFDCVMEAPVPHGAPLEMSQALNDSMGRQIRAHPEQWFWVARRWRD